MSTPTASAAIDKPTASITMAKPTAAIAMGSPTSPAQEPKNSGLAIASMVCGIVSFFLFGIVLGVLAIIFGAIAINRINERPHELKGLCQAKAGMICGIIAVVFWVILLVIWYT